MQESTSSYAQTTENTRRVCIECGKLKSINEYQARYEKGKFIYDIFYCIKCFNLKNKETSIES